MPLILFILLILPLNVYPSFYKMEVWEVLKGKGEPKYFVDPESKKLHSTYQYIESLMEVESEGRNITTPEKNVRDVSYGPLQIRCKTAKWMGYKKSCNTLRYAENSIPVAVKYALMLLKKHRYNVKKSASAYNAGTPTLRNSRYTKKVLALLSSL